MGACFDRNGGCDCRCVRWSNGWDRDRQRGGQSSMAYDNWESENKTSGTCDYWSEDLELVFWLRRLKTDGIAESGD